MFVSGIQKGGERPFGLLKTSILQVDVDSTPNIDKAFLGFQAMLPRRHRQQHLYGRYSEFFRTRTQKFRL